MFGFLASSDLVNASSDGLAGNYVRRPQCMKANRQGLRDCVHLLEWTRENIASFGGDAENVTVFGQSAGGVATGAMLFSGRNLARRAILMAGAPGTLLFHRLEAAEPLYSAMLEHFGVRAPQAAERVAALRSLSQDDVLAFAKAHPE